MCDCIGCGRTGAQVKQYRIDLPGGFWTIKLCKEHSQPLRDFLSGLPKHLYTKVADGHHWTRKTNIVATTIEEVERQAQANKTAKKTSRPKK